MPTTSTVRIVVLGSVTNVWCEWCGLPCSTMLTYIVESADHAPLGMNRLAYCEGCEEEALLR